MTIIDVLRSRAASDPERTAFIYLANGEHEQARITYSALLAKAEGIAAYIQERGLVGHRIVLSYPAGIEYVAAMLGCMMAGAVAVPTELPHRSRGRQRLLDIQADSGATLGLTVQAKVSSFAPGLRWIATDASGVPEARFNHGRIGDIAYLQYTSGSTSSPRGVIITHRCLIQNLSMIERDFGVTPQSVIVSWLPIYHDMGLIAGIKQPIFSGVPCVLMSHASFLQRPLRWLEAISHYRASISGGPDFAYDLCARAAERDLPAALDLSCWNVAFNGAERVRRETLDAFSSAFSGSGFRRASFYPCYGLAEATLLVSTNQFDDRAARLKLDRTALARDRAVAAGNDATGEFVTCGAPSSPLSVVIVDPHSGETCAEGVVGEIWVSGESVAAGYWNRPEETARCFHAVANGRRYLRTGDLGFLIDGRLAITGRLKDLIIIRGLNHYPEDIESTVRNCHPSLRGTAAAFAVNVHGEERVVVVLEISRKESGYDFLAAAIRSAVARDHDIATHGVVFVKTGAIPRTTSGKVRRSACRELYLSEKLEPVSQSVLPHTSHQDDFLTPDHESLKAKPPAEAVHVIEQYLCRAASCALELPPGIITLQSVLLESGIDSMAATGLRNRIEVDLDVNVPATMFLEDNSIAECAVELVEQIRRGPARSRAVNESVTEAPLSAAQQRLLAIEQAGGHAALNIVDVARLRGQLNTGALKASIGDIVQRHESLRSYIVDQAHRPCQRIAANSGAPLEHHDLGREGLDEIICRLATARFRLDRPPLLGCHLIRTADNERILVLVCSHHVADARSVDIFWRELEWLYTLRVTSSAVHLPPPEAQYRDFVAWQAGQRDSGEWERHRAYWRARLSNIRPAPLPFDQAHPVRPGAPAVSANFELRRDVVAMLRKASRRERQTPYTILAAALGALLWKWTGHSDILISSPVSGRSQGVFESAMGCFANRTVLRMNVAEGATFRDLTRMVKALVKGAIEHQDLPFDQITQAALDGNWTQLPYDPFSQVLFQYERPAPTPVLRGLETRREWWVHSPANFPLTVSVADYGDRIEGRIVANADVFAARTVAALAETYTTILESGLGNPDAALYGPPAGSRRDAFRDARITVSATFTADLTIESLEFWKKQMDANWGIEITPYNQLFHQFANPHGAIHRNAAGVNVILLRFEDWLRFATDSDETGPAEWRRVEDRTRELVRLISEEARRGSAIIIGICPDSPRRRANAQWRASALALEQELTAALGGHSTIRVFGMQALERLYPVAGYDDPGSDLLGHVPFTRKFYASLGTMTARQIYSLRGNRCKVVTLDCDNTLWKGICGETGLSGVEVDAPAAELQRLVLELRERGMIICLCSKNNEADVRAVFASRPDMLLRWEHVQAVRVNWQRKSSNLESIARQLGLDLDSFVVIDDDPVECAEIEASCPQVMTVLLPTDRAGLGNVLRHVWAFDARPATTEDTLRAEHYRLDLERERSRATSRSFEEFLETLLLRIDIVPAEVADVPRLAQLVERTNQFNCSNLRRTEREIVELLNNGWEALIVRVRDRFGDYGATGALLFRCAFGLVIVDTFVLSCRALGRRVENRMFEAVMARARTAGADYVDIVFTASARNMPALEFLSSMGGSNEDGVFRFGVAVPETESAALARQAVSS